jgi:nitrogen fixation/metabolism regulation signal transduction histidine kinase
MSDDAQAWSAERAVAELEPAIVEARRVAILHVEAIERLVDQCRRAGRSPEAEIEAARKALRSAAAKLAKALTLVARLDPDLQARARGSRTR